MTAFYTFRMVGMAFFGEESKHVKHMKETGHHIHEVGKVMWLPFGILAVATIVGGLIGPIFEAQLHHTFAEYLASSFGIREHTTTENSGRAATTILGLNPTAASGVCWRLCDRRGARVRILYWKTCRSENNISISNYKGHLEIFVQQMVSEYCIILGWSNWPSSNLSSSMEIL